MYKQERELEKWTNRNLLKLNKKWKVLPLGRMSSRHQDVPGAAQLES